MTAVSIQFGRWSLIILFTAFLQLHPLYSPAWIFANNPPPSLPLAFSTPPLIWLTVLLLLAVIISTTTVMICSHTLNRQFTFKTSRHQHQSDVKFCAVPNHISRNKEKTPPQKCLFLAPGAGFEPAAYWLTANRSTAELPRNMSCIIASFWIVVKLLTDNFQCFF